MKTPSIWQVGSILMIGILAVSMAAILIRLATDAAAIEGVGFSLFLAASRLIIAAAILLATGGIEQPPLSPPAYFCAVAAGFALSFHFALWTASLSFTSIAASTVLVTTNPIWVSLFSWLWFGEKLSRITVMGMLIAFSGGVFVAFGEGTTTDDHSNPLLGNFLALAGAVMVSLYLLLGREAQRQGLSVRNYITIAYSSAAIILFPLPFLFDASYIGYPKKVYLYVFLLAIFSQLIGHTSFNWAIRWISPTLVTLALLFEPIASSILGYLVFGEIPSSAVFCGGSILLVGVAIAIKGTQN